MVMNKSLVLILATYIVLAIAWNAIVPPYENLDELEHAEVIRHIAVTGKLPVHDEAEDAGYNVRQEASQPPLYHILAAVWSRVWHLSTTPHVPEPIPTDMVACGPSDSFYNKATWIHNPAQSGFFGLAASRSIHMLRLFSTLLQLLTLIGAYTLAQRVFPRGPVSILTAGLVAFNPQFILLSSGVNNDNILIPLATWGLVLVFDLWGKDPNRWHLVRLGIVCGLATLSKLSGLGLLGLAGIVLLIRGLHKKESLKHLVSQGLWVLIPALILITPWIVRNMHLYGDPTALTPMLEKVGQRKGSTGFGELSLMFLSFWGQLPCSFYPRFVYWFYLILVLGGLLGLVIGWRKFPFPQKQAIILCAGWFFMIVAAWIRWNNLTPAPGGRLLFPAISALSLVLAAGWTSFWKQRARIWTALLPIWALIVLVAGPLAIFSPPKLIATTEVIPNPTDVIFGDDLILRGHQTQVRKSPFACLFLAQSYCAPLLDMTLYWQLNSPTQTNNIMVIQLVSPVPGNTSLRFNYNYWPGRGNYPTSSWISGKVIRDHYIFPLPNRDVTTGAWYLLVAFVNPENGKRLLASRQGESLGDAVHLDILRVPGLNPDVPGWGNPAAPVTFGNAIILQDARIIEVDTSTWRVDLLWESQVSVAQNYTVFVHGYDGIDNLLSTGDGPPQLGGYPTSLWLPGDRILDSHNLPIANQAFTYIAVGLYDPLTGERLPAVRLGTQLPNDASPVW
jgi:4-amino-4-deoxy-L-arabinose transferase-like glycosyltransferase